MSEKSALVIRIPSINGSFLRTRSFWAALLLTAVASAALYWFFAIHPYLWIRDGHVQALSLPLSSDVPGRVVQLGPGEGERVRKGELLFALDTDLVTAQQERIATLRQEMAAEERRMDKAMQEFLQASSASELGLGAAEAIQAPLAALEEAQKRAELAKTALQALQLESEKRIFQAPRDAIVLRRSAEVGAFTAPGEPLYTFYDPKEMWVEAYLPEKVLSKVEVGMRARLLFPALSSREWQGKVSWMSPVVEERGLRVKICLGEPIDALRPGLSAKVGLRVR